MASQRFRPLFTMVHDVAQGLHSSKSAVHPQSRTTRGSMETGTTLPQNLAMVVREIGLQEMYSAFTHAIRVFQNSPRDLPGSAPVAYCPPSCAVRPPTRSVRGLDCIILRRPSCVRPLHRLPASVQRASIRAGLVSSTPIRIFCCPKQGNATPVIGARLCLAGPIRGPAAVARRPHVASHRAGVMGPRSDCPFCFPCFLFSPNEPTANRRTSVMRSRGSKGRTRLRQGPASIMLCIVGRRAEKMESCLGSWTFTDPTKESRSITGQGPYCAVLYSRDGRTRSTGLSERTDRRQLLPDSTGTLKVTRRKVSFLAGAALCFRPPGIPARGGGGTGDVCDRRPRWRPPIDSARACVPVSPSRSDNMPPSVGLSSQATAPQPGFPNVLLRCAIRTGECLPHRDELPRLQIEFGLRHFNKTVYEGWHQTPLGGKEKDQATGAHVAALMLFTRFWLAPGASSFAVLDGNDTR